MNRFIRANVRKVCKGREWIILVGVVCCQSPSSTRTISLGAALVGWRRRRYLAWQFWLPFLSWYSLLGSKVVGLIWALGWLVVLTTLEECVDHTNNNALLSILPPFQNHSNVIRYTQNNSISPLPLVPFISLTEKHQYNMVVENNYTLLTHSPQIHLKLLVVYWIP